MKRRTVKGGGKSKQSRSRNTVHKHTAHKIRRSMLTRPRTYRATPALLEEIRLRDIQEKLTHGAELAKMETRMTRESRTAVSRLSAPSQTRSRTHKRSTVRRVKPETLQRAIMKVLQNPESKVSTKQLRDDLKLLKPALKPEEYDQLSDAIARRAAQRQASHKEDAAMAKMFGALGVVAENNNDETL